MPQQTKQICACGCEHLVAESTECRHLDGQKRRIISLHVLSANLWVKSLAKKNATKATAKKILLGGPRKCPHQMQRSSTPSPSLPDPDIPAFSYHDDDLPTTDEEPAPIESANSGGDSDLDGHMLLTVRLSNCIAPKIVQVCQNPWGSGHQELIQEDDPSDEMDTDGESLGDEETDDEDTDWRRITSAAPGEEGISLWDLLGQGFLKEASELGV